MATITREQLVSLLLGIKGASFLTVVTNTDTRAKVKAKVKDDNGDEQVIMNAYQRPILKTSKVNVCVCFWYEEGVLRRLEKEGKIADEFKKGESWHTPIFRNGNLTPLCESKNPENPKLYLRCMDKPLRFLTYDIDNILEITHNGETFAVLHEEPVTIAA